MKKVWTILLLVVILSLGAYAAMIIDNYRGGGLRADVERMRAERDGVHRPARQQARQERPAQRQRAATPPAPRAPRPDAQPQAATARFNIDLAAFYEGIELTDQQQSQANAIAADHRRRLEQIRRSQREAQETARLGMLADLMRVNGSKLPDPAWMELSAAQLHDAVQASDAVTDEAKAAVASLYDGWLKVRDRYTEQMRTARQHTAGRLTALLTSEQRARLDTKGN